MEPPASRPSLVARFFHDCASSAGGARRPRRRRQRRPAIIAGAAKSTPNYFVDEYRYFALARSLAETGRPLVRGAGTHFPALLQPSLTAPAWLLGDTSAAYAAIKLEGALVMSLAAIPVFLLALRLGQRRSSALLCSVVAVALPEMLYSSWVLAEPYAYPLVLGAVAAGRWRSAAAGAGAVSRSCSSPALRPLPAPSSSHSRSASPPPRSSSVSDNARCSQSCAGKHSSSALSCFQSPRCCCSHPHPRLLQQLQQGRLRPGWLTGRLGTNGFILLFTAGWVVVPGALFGLGLASPGLARGSSSASAPSSGCWRSALLLQASIYGDLDRAQGRYFFYLVPLVGLHFCLYASRGWPHARAYAPRRPLGPRAVRSVPLSGYAEGRQDTVSRPPRRVPRRGDARRRNGCPRGGARRGSRIVARRCACPGSAARARRSASRRRSRCSWARPLSRRASTSATPTSSAAATCRRPRTGSMRRGSETSRSCTSQPVAPTRSPSSSGTTR